MATVIRTLSDGQSTFMPEEPATKYQVERKGGVVKVSITVEDTDLGVVLTHIIHTARKIGELQERDSAETHTYEIADDDESEANQWPR
ncbi:MAG: hypothetical protein M3P51_04265 [Chloroflexota bacterium]|nr:hypothetical protein [Chloroflexota bacterium]